MKRLLYLFSFLLFPTLVTFGQDDVSPITKFLLKKGYTFSDSARHTKKSKMWPDTLYYNTPYKAKLLGSFTIPISFTSIELTNNTNTANNNTPNSSNTTTSNSSVTVSPNISLGIGYTWFWGDFIFNENDKITVDPKVFFGVMASAGIVNSFQINKLALASFSPGGFIGVSSFTFFLGYDLVNHTPSLDVGSRIDFYSISQKFLNIVGKVHEIRKHHRIAPPITEY